MLFYLEKMLFYRNKGKYILFEIQGKTKERVVCFQDSGRLKEDSGGPMVSSFRKLEDIQKEA